MKCAANHQLFFHRNQEEEFRSCVCTDWGKVTMFRKTDSQRNGGESVEISKASYELHTFQRSLQLGLLHIPWNFWLRDGSV